MENFNEPSVERIALLKSLQDAIGGAPPHFWAACQICDLKALERLVKCGRNYPNMLIAFTQQTCVMASYCKVCEFGVESVNNLITLSCDVHAAWAKGAFALKPISISDDKMTLEVQLFWQEKQKDTSQTISLLTTPSSTRGLDHNASAFGATLGIYNRNTRKDIQSGDYFKLQTDDPETKPLPSFQLLELQWFIQRIRGMAGAADIDWEANLNSDDSDYEGERGSQYSQTF